MILTGGGGGGGSKGEEKSRYFSHLAMSVGSVRCGTLRLSYNGNGASSMILFIRHATYLA